jgi:hypothetical protein
MSNSGNFSFSSSGNNNNSNSSAPTTSNNDSTSTNVGQVDSSDLSGSLVLDIIQLPILSLTIILAFAYTILVLVRPVFRANKLNWFTINVCMTSAFLSTIMLAMTIKEVQNESSSLPCRAQGFLLVMAAYQMVYSHNVVTFSRLLTIVYASKRIFRSNLCIWICIGSGWLIAVLFALPSIFVDGFTCSSSTRPAFLPYYTLVTILILPTSIISICNIRILLFVRQSSRRVHADGGGNGVSHARDVRLLKTMIATFTVFIGGWGPLFLEQIFDQSSSVPTVVDDIFQILPALSMLGDVSLIIYINEPIRLFLWQLVVKRHRVVVDNTLGNNVTANTHNINKH